LGFPYFVHALRLQGITGWTALSGEVRQIAVNVAKLPDLLRKPS
jgi:hypothetical protein